MVGFKLFGLLFLILALTFMSAPGSTTASGANSFATIDTDEVDGRTAVVLDAAGNPVIAYTAKTAAGADLRVLHCNDPNCEGDTGVTADQVAGAGGVSMVLDAAGNPVISYPTGENYPFASLKVMHCNDPGCAGGDEIGVRKGAWGVSSSLQLDGAGNPVVVFGDPYPNGNRVWLLRCVDPDCATEVTPELVVYLPLGSGGAAGLSLALDGNWYPVISGYKNFSNDVWVIHCGDATCSSGNVYNAVDGVGDGGETSLQLDDFGHPVIAYDGGNDLKVAHCNDPNCDPAVNGTENVETPDDMQNTGTTYVMPSMVLDEAGYPAISYLDHVPYDLKLIRCDDPDCAGDESGNITVVDSVGNMGRVSSLALGADSFPAITYADQTNYDVKFVHCSDPNCAGFTNRLDSGAKLPYAQGSDVVWTGGPHKLESTPSTAYMAPNEGSGLDFTCAEGRTSGQDCESNGGFKVRAILPGEVVAVQTTSCASRGLGCFVAISHADKTVAVYAHLDPAQIQVLAPAPPAPPIYVGQGQFIAVAGETGTGADNVHLHLELRKGNGSGDTCFNNSDCFGEQLSWDGLDIDGWRIYAYYQDGEGTVAYNYDGSAVKGNAQVIPNFPYLDEVAVPTWRGPGTSDEVIARVGLTFYCSYSPMQSCEDNAQGQPCLETTVPTPTPPPAPTPKDCGTVTQFAKLGDGGLLAGGAAGSTWPPLSAGHLTSTNQVVAAVGGIAELPNVASEALETAGSTGLDTWLVAGITAAVLLAALALSAGAWHARRRS